MVKLSFAQLNSKKYSEIIVRDPSYLKGGDSTAEYLAPLTEPMMHDPEVEEISLSSYLVIPLLGIDY